MLTTDKEGLKKSNLKSVLWATEFLIQYLDDEDCGGATSIFRDKDGDGFHGDIGYLYEGLESMNEYAARKLKAMEGK